jgi:serine/threonine protein kinase
MHSVNKDYSLRLFLKNIKDQAERYARISDFVQNDDLPCTVTFDFLTRGIKFRNEWLPALKMEWVEGLSFDDYIVENLRDSNKLGFLASSFMKMMEEMQAAGIAHGDLQHGNIIVCNDELRLVDYDGMYVPAMRNFASNELGHPNYQHPNRDQRHFGPYLDNFSAWIIYA